MSRVSVGGVLALSLFASLAQASEAGSPRIFGGQEAQVGDVPALALILVEAGEGATLCTGALIAPRWVLTAAHCIDADTLGVDNVAGKAHVYFDRMSAFVQSGREVDVRRVVVHPGYRGVVSGHDVGLIELAEEVTDRIPIAYDLDPASMSPGDSVDFIGYGATAPVTFTGSGVAHRLDDQAVVSCSTLGESFPFGDDVMLCFDQRDGKGLCVGDSGGPVIADVDGEPTVVGVNSIVFDPTATTSGPTCAYYAAATRTDAEAEFIEETQLTTGQEPDDGDDDGCGCRVGGRPHGLNVGVALLGGLALLAVRRRRR